MNINADFAPSFVSLRGVAGAAPPSGYRAEPAALPPAQADTVSISAAGRAAAALDPRQPVGDADPRRVIQSNTETESAVEPVLDPQEDTEAASTEPTSTEAQTAQQTTEKQTDEETDDAVALDETELQEVQQLQRRDSEVRVHEQAHKAVGGELAGSINLDLTTGPDGKRYATSGSVSIDVSEVPNEPSKTVRKMERVQRAALAPADPSSADRQAASDAAKKAQGARQQLAATSRERVSSTADKQKSDDAETTGAGDKSPTATRSTQPNRGQRALTDAEIAAPRPTATQEQLTQQTQLSYQF